MTEPVSSCDDARALASRELDGELDAADLGRLEAHLASCAACREERGALARVDALIEDAFADHPFDQKLVREIVRMAEARAARPVAQPAQPRGAIVKLRAGGLVAAAAAAVVIVAVGAGLFGSPPETHPSVAVLPEVLAHAHGAGLKVGKVLNGAEPLAVHEGEVVLNTGGAGTLLLEDGTRVDLRPDTSVALHRELDGGVTLRIAPNRETTSGAVFCEVAKQHHHAFRVMTGTISAEVVGTKFQVLATGKESSVSVIEGHVRVRCGQDVRLLSLGQEAVVEDSRPVLIARPLDDPRAILAWNARVLAKLPAPAAPAARPTVPVSSGTHPVSAPQPTGGPNNDLDQPIDKPEQKPVKKK